MVYETFSAEETEKLGEQIGREAKPGEVYTLIGDLASSPLTDITRMYLSSTA